MVQIKIYKYTNIINNKVYIGQTSWTLAQRAKSNGSGYKHCLKFYSAIKKYSWEAFKPEVLEIVDESIADEREKYYIQLYNSTNKNFGYNIDLGGHTEKVRSQETKDKISKSGLGMKNSRARNVCINGIPTNMTVRDCAKSLGMSESTLKSWCVNHKFGYSYL